MERKVLVPIADGIEELETVALCDILTRGGAKVTTASVERNRQVTASRGFKLVADRLIEQVVEEDWELIVLPGGVGGARALSRCTLLVDLLKTQADLGKKYGAICASPALVLARHGLLAGKEATCYPSFGHHLTKRNIQKVVIDQNCATSQGPGTAIEFGLSLVEWLYGPDRRRQVAQGMLA